jgi:hypothetical protein
MPKWIMDRDLELEPSEAPPGITLSAARPVPGGAAFDIKADPSTKAGFETNLIIDLFTTNQGPNKPAAKGQQRAQVSTLQAIPILLTPPNTP